MKKFITLFFTALFFLSAQSQTRYLVKFKDKGTNPFSIANPSGYLGPRALQRRARYNISIDSTDLPITPRYIDSVRLAGAVTILNASKWLNEVAIRTTDAAALAKISSYPFVVSAVAVASFGAGNSPVDKRLDSVSGIAMPPASSFTGSIEADYFSYGKSHGQVHIHQGEFLHNHGFRGEGMDLALLDAGFYHYLTLPTFDSIRANNQILNTYDFVDNETSVNEDDSHGMNCLSTIAANLPGTFVGTCPKATFCLFRTEDVFSETRIEEHNLAAGFERADSIGVDVCSISLGYYDFDIPAQSYVYADLTGNITLSAIATDLAAKKGLLPVVAAGNEGQHPWHYITTPGDADSAMTVGAVDTLGNVGGFSSYGPSADGQIKPNLAAVGVNAVIANTSNGQPTYGSGTSFATPNLAGLTTCLWQAFLEFNNMTILDAMQRSATKSTTPDDRVGYGIPDMKKAFVILLKRSYTQQAAVANCYATLQLNVKYDNTMNIIVERKPFGATAYSPVQTITGSGSFTNKSVSITDNLASLTSGSVKYRVRLDIATDTSFYLDSLTVNFSPKPILGADKAVAICNNAPFDLTTQYNTAGLSAAYTFGGTPVANPQAVTTSGIYELVAGSTSGCADTASITLNLITKLDIGPDKTVKKCNSDYYNLNSAFNTAGLNASFTLNGVSVPSPSQVQAGTYQLIVSNTSGCIDTAAIIVADDPQLCPANNVTLNPNPVTDNATITISRAASSKIAVVIINASGQRVYERTYQQAPGVYVNTINMQDMSGGVYYLSVYADDKKITTQRFLKR